MCAAIGIDHAGLIRESDAPLGDAAERLSLMVARRLAHEPVSRILGRREFWGLPFAISADVLDPRPETEGLVASVLDAVGTRRAEPLEILDLGTGSGAILAALLRDMQLATGVAVDRSHAACRVARGNLRALGLADRTRVVCGNWAEALRGTFDVVVSNPPYIASAEIATLSPDVRGFDPLEALDGGTDGLSAFRAISVGLGDRLAPGGLAAFECGSGQGAAVAALLSTAALPPPAVYKDLAGHDRVVLTVTSQIRGTPGGSVAEKRPACGGMNAKALGDSGESA